MDALGLFISIAIFVGILIALAVLGQQLGKNSGPKVPYVPRVRPRIIPWYELPDSVIAIRPYQSPDLATTDANLAAPFGWSIQSVTTSDGHVNIGRTVTGAVFTGGLSLLVGGSRTKGNVTVTFIRPAVSVAHDPLPLRSGVA